MRLTGQDVGDTRRTLRSIHLLLIDATLDGDTFLLDVAVEGLRGAGAAPLGLDADPETRARLQGRAEALAEEALLALERLPSLTGLAAYEPDSQAACFLRAIAEHPNLGNDGIAAQLEAGPERVSALGRELVQRGLAAKRRVGRRNAWDITPRGVQVLGLIDAGGARRPQREHRLPALG